MNLMPAKHTSYNLKKIKVTGQAAIFRTDFEIVLLYFEFLFSPDHGTNFRFANRSRSHCARAHRDRVDVSHTRFAVCANAASAASRSSVRRFCGQARAVRNVVLSYILHCGTYRLGTCHDESQHAAVPATACTDYRMVTNGYSVTRILRNRACARWCHAHH